VVYMSDTESSARLHEFNIELELLIASMLRGVSLSDIKAFYKDQSMVDVAAKVLRLVRR
jgi:hypothetical protein